MLFIAFTNTMILYIYPLAFVSIESERKYDILFKKFAFFCN